MPEINHKAPAVATEGTKEVAAGLAAAIADPKVSADDLEAQIAAILQKQAAAKKAAMKPKEPDWSQISEADSYKPDVYIPIIEHDIPDYMNMKLKDAEYEVVWANRDQRRYGQLVAEGYENLRAEHVHPSFKIPLPFDGDGNYIYQDVICLRVHKRILYGKRRRALEISQNQLRKRGADARIKAHLTELIENDPGLEAAFMSKGLGFYDTDVA